MLANLKVSGYRSICDAAFKNFARVNVLVGGNGSGKTSFLEALYLYLSHGSPDAIVGIAKRRGEYEKNQDRREWVPTVRHLFLGHEIHHGGVPIVLSGNIGEVLVSVGLDKYVFRGEVEGEAGVLSLSSTVPYFASRQFDEQAARGLESSSLSPYVSSGQTLTLNVEYTPRGIGEKSRFAAPITAQGGLSLPHKGDQGFFNAVNLHEKPMIFVSSDGVGGYSFAQMQDRIASMGGEAMLADALRLLCPEIKTVGFLSVDDRPPELISNGALVELSSGPKGRLPIRTMGDGMRRLLVVAMALTCVQGGYLILDEVDAGLHYSAMSKLWSLILHAARRNDVQVFATTHSMDCLRGLSGFCGKDGDFASDVRLYSFGRNDRRLLDYSGSELAAAIENEIEVRS